ncbi:uncharacterized protein C8Q71DRAFT_66044 [Rhodofomes roseus]|uniref:Uncharacterized protein n=1 Tax=Rhodofomes roseus TaxID=34475 RepID=A0ABQ8KEG4_9APHY|nr:uncharacterized protein C8Q71DRAFT_66044 [Rhodofomes roseus]KAH9836095.1 hypothetical protein C8Q71DRAFT_66044 [Rhodofomes roseus]
MAYALVLPLACAALTLASPTLSAPAQEIPAVPSFICHQNSIAIWNFLVYITTNYITHAAAVPISAEVGRYTERVTRRDRGYWTQLISLFLPFGALARTIILIAEHVRCKGNDVLAALHHGALLVVVRSPGWEPPTSGEIVFAQLPPGTDNEKAEYVLQPHHAPPSVDCSISPDHDPCPYAVIIVDSLDDQRETHWLIKDLRNRSIHGHIQVPLGYSLAVPADKSYTEHLIARDLNPTKNIKIHRASGVMQMLVSVVQIIAATYTLYSTEGAQIETWGYAAYGLSVFPYALMSVMNILCASIVGEYASGHVLRTPILHEAERRGGHFDGAVGTVRKVPKPVVGDASSTGYVAVHMQTIEDEDNPSDRKLVVTTPAWEREFTLCTEDSEEACRASRFTVSSLRHDGAADNPEVARHRALKPVEVFITLTLFLAAMTLPHGLLYALTRFRTGHSTVAQRAWMTAWLAADQLSSLGTLVFWVVWKRVGSVVPVSVHYVGVALLVAASAGGFVTMSEMYLQDQGLGTCSS